LEIHPVTHQRDIKKFIELPYKLNKNLAHWIPPLRTDQKNIFNPGKNSMLKHCRYQLFLLYDKDRIIGRIAVYINEAYNKHWAEKTGFFYMKQLWLENPKHRSRSRCLQ